MGWSGAQVLVTPAEILRTMKAIAEDFGVVVACVCGASRWCPAAEASEDSNAFWKLHTGHVRKG